MTLLTQSTTLARPSHRLVEIYDSDAYRTDSTAVAAAERNVVGSNGYHLYLFSLQSDLEVEVTVRVWDEPQPSPGEAEDFTEVSLESESGILVIGQFAFGPAAEMSLPRPGVYEGHVSWTGRIAAAEYYEHALRQIEDDWSTARIRQLWHDNPQPEQYTLDLWYVRESEPADDEVD
ncbi:hypothetical protein GT352_36800 [Streptomyces sp. SID1046]|uniref:hypothetical protein n=1 Tax=Streptomyces sp. SID1046 TaxID=2690249 RepID=UPI001371180F|nr:hypothetical protein [Streptomyces sp. SID1046]MYV79429.1 hypothetical protein [Streptomyces sp. SID1046]